MRLQHSPHAAWTDHERVALLDLDAHDPRPLILEEPGATIWVEADGRTVEELCALLAGLYGRPLEVLRAEVEPFVRDLLARGLLVESGQM